MKLLNYNSWAVVIKDIDEDRRAQKLIEKLKEKEYKVVAISAKVKHMDEIEIYESLKDVPHNIDVVAIVEESVDNYLILDEIELLDIENIWLEKGSYSEEMIKRAKNMKLNIEYDSSLYKELR